jgi:outer membrane protein assembly factor BamA
LFAGRLLCRKRGLTFKGVFIDRVYQIFLYLNLILFSHTNIAFCQNLDNSDIFFVVDTIRINGNNSTKDFIILNELTFRVGDRISESDLHFNRERIYSLGLFNQVLIERLYEDGKNVVSISVEESWYIFPLPFVNIKERDYKKLSYGIYLVYKNFRGRNETIFSGISFGYNPSYSLTYLNPNIFSDGSYSLRFSSSFTKKRNRSVTAESQVGNQFDYKQFYSTLLFGNRLNNFNRIFTNVSFNYIDVDNYIRDFTINNSGIDKYLIIGFGYEYDTRDLIQFPKEGNYFFIFANHNGIGSKFIDYQTFKVDIRHYQRLYDELSFKLRTSLRTTLGSRLPLYDYSLIGNEEKIRGNFNKSIEDRNYFIFSAEKYYPLLNETKIDLTFIPIIPKQLLSYRVALYFQTFFDYGAVFKNLKKMTSSLLGYGIGISLLILPHNTLRFEYGFNNKKQGEFILDLGTSF